MTSTGCKTLIYFVGGLNDLRESKKGIEIMAEAVARNFSQDAGTQCELHQFSQATVIQRKSSKKAATIPLFTSLRAVEHAQQLDGDIWKAINKHKPVDLVIVSYSSGSAVLRNTLARALIANNRRGKDSAKTSWTGKLRKIIHIGGMTTGWEFNSEVPKLQLWLGPIVRPICPHWFPWQIYKGSKFITETRIALNRQRDHEKGKQPVTALEEYLVGTKDEYITPADAIELGGSTQEGSPRYIEVSGCTHTSILSRNGKVNKAVRDYISSSIGREDPDLPSSFTRINPDDIDDYLDPFDNEPARRDLSVRHVVIVLHGIRDNGMWGKRIGNRIKEAWRRISNEENSRTVRVVTATYGYFSLWDFLRPGGRRRAVDWFQNIYANVCALYPDAEISFIGHSNGTYLGTQALQCENLDYKYMILAGSVVQRDFWIRKDKGKQWKKRVTRLFSFRSLDDWVVALLSGGLEVIPGIGRCMNVGGAGAYGFRDLQDGKEQRTIKGGHGAAIQSDAWDQLAEFLLHKDPSTAMPGDKGHLRAVTSKDDRLLWSVNIALNKSKVFRLLGGFGVLAAFLVCFMPLIIPVAVLAGAINPTILLEHPMTSMLLIVLSSLVAYSCLKHI